MQNKDENLLYTPPIKTKVEETLLLHLHSIKGWVNSTNPITLRSQLETELKNQNKRNSISPNINPTKKPSKLNLETDVPIERNSSTSD